MSTPGEVRRELRPEEDPIVETMRTQHDEIAHDEIAHDEIAHDEIAHDEIAHVSMRRSTFIILLVSSVVTFVIWFPLLIANPYWWSSRIMYFFVVVGVTFLNFVLSFFFGIWIYGKMTRLSNSVKTK